MANLIFILLFALLFQFGIPIIIVLVITSGQKKEINFLKQEIGALRHHLHHDHDPQEFQNQGDCRTPPAFQAPQYVQSSPVSQVQSESPTPPVSQAQPTLQNQADLQSPPKFHHEQAYSDYQAPYTQPESVKIPGVMENWVGRNVLGIAASVLIFIGLIFFGVLIYKHITDEIKIILMFAISTAITGLGIFLSIKNKNTFTLIFTGCGLGSFFISVMLTHIYFNKLSDIAAFSILLGWMAAALYIAKKLESVSLSIVAHMGMIFSICFAYALSLSDEKLVLLMIYQVVSITVIILGNILCCRKTYRFGLFISLALIIITGAFMWLKFPSMNPHSGYYVPFAETSLPLWSISAAFIAQFICASFLSYLLSISACRLENKEVRLLTHLGNKALWIIVFFMNIYRLAYRLAYHSAYTGSSGENIHLTAILYAVLIGIAIMIIHASITIFMSLKLNFDGITETVSVISMSIVTSVLLFILMWAQNDITTFPTLSFLIFPALLLLLAKKISRNHIYTIAANVLFSVDLLYMLCNGYHQLSEYGTVFLPVCYMLIYLCVIWGQWLRLDGESKGKYSIPARLISYLTVGISLAVILLNSQLQYKNTTFLLVITALNIILTLLRYDGGPGSGNNLYWVMQAQELLFTAINAGFIAFIPKENNTLNILYYILSILTITLAFLRTKNVFGVKLPDTSVWEILSGLKLTILTLAIINGHTAWFEQSYAFSLSCMMTALACIITGFIIKAKHLRLYGLALTLFCVLKLVTYDVAGLETVLRVAALIGGGIICFIISAIYSYSVKKFNTSKRNETKCGGIEE